MSAAGLLTCDLLSPAGMRCCARRVSRLLPAALLALCSAAPLDAQGKGDSAFTPFPNGIATQYRFDLARLFFPTPAAAGAERRMLIEELNTLARLGARPVTSSANLLVLLQQSDSLRGAVERQESYLSLASSIDTDDRTSPAALDSLDGAYRRAVAWLTPVLAALDDTTLARFARERPALGRYGFLIASARRARTHTLSASEEALLDAVTPTAIGWQAPLFQTAVAETRYEPVHTPRGDIDFLSHQNEVFNSPIRAVREAGYHVGRTALLSHRDIYAFGLTRTVTSRNLLARLRRYRDYPEETYTDRYLSREMVTTTLDGLAQEAGLNRRYERDQIDWIRRVAGYDTVHTWDLTLPGPAVPTPRFTIVDAAAIIRAATAPLGAEYAREMAALLDPAQGRLDLVPRPKRVSRPGFSTGSVGYPSVFFQGRFEGYMADAIILAHEGGHAVQNMLMTSAHVRPVYASGPAFFTESFAGFNELLVTDYLAKTAATPALKRFYDQQFLNQATEIFKSAREAAFEQALYDSIGTAGELSAEQMEQLMQSVGSRYSLWFGPDSAGRGERTMEWVNARQFFTWPLYRINYVYSKLLALAYFDAYTRDRAAFIPAYSALLRNGYDGPPAELLQRLTGLRLESTPLIAAAKRVIEHRLAEFENLSADDRR